MKTPYKAYIRIVYDDGSTAEKEFDLNAALEYFRQEQQLSFVESVDTARCSKRIGHYIKILSLTSRLYEEDENKKTDMSSFSVFKKRITSAIKSVSEVEGVRYPTLEDQVCRQMNQGKDQLTARVVQFFHTARTVSPEDAVAEPESLYRYVVDNGFLSDKVMYDTSFDEQEFLRVQLLAIAQRIAAAAHRLD